MSTPILPIQALRNAHFPEIIGQDVVKEQVKSALLANRHLILVGPPGVGKTTLAKAIASLVP
jgi:MoxR-like ATPase